MAEVTAKLLTAPVQSAVRPYSPSWFDLLSVLVVRLPGPNWLYYLGFSLFLIALESVLRGMKA